MRFYTETADAKILFALRLPPFFLFFFHPRWRPTNVFYWPTTLQLPSKSRKGERILIKLRRKSNDLWKAARQFLPWSNPTLKMISSLVPQSEKRLLFLLYSHIQELRTENHFPTWFDWHQNWTQLEKERRINPCMDMPHVRPWIGH